MIAERSKSFVNAMKLLDFHTDQAENPSLLFVKNANYDRLSATEIFSLQAASSFRADAVYFRRFSDNRPPQPQIYIYDNTDARMNNEQYAQIQRELWSSCIIPLFLIIEKSNVVIFDSRKPVDTLLGSISASPIEVLSFTSEALKEYSARLFDNGSFWERERANNHFLDSTSAFNDLLFGLKKIRKSFIEQSRLPHKTAHKLLVLSILVKYLEERGTDGETLFAKNFFHQFGANDFCGVLRNKGKVVQLFDKLSERFNGQVFAWNDKKDIAALKRCDLSQLANFLDADTDNNQYVLWRKYSFSHLPVELISSVYEEFLGQDKRDVVYTPHFLVNTLIDECMPLNLPRESFKLIDGSCGSGIFLVAAYKRMVDWWKYSCYLKDGAIPTKPTLQTLKSILKNNIYGVDIEEDATRLTIFSLALALCDMLTPKQIWTELKFDDLTTNIINNDFFTFTTTSIKTFDLVIGNPPFIELNKPQFERIVKKNGLQVPVKVPQNQIALLFLDQAMEQLKPGGNLCLIMPSGPMLYNDTLDYRKYFFDKFDVSQILDFTNLSTTLFGKASVATAAIFVTKRTPVHKPITHITVRRTKSSKERIFFEIDHYDFHSVHYEDAMRDRYIWKSNLLGGGRINHLINRLSGLRTFGSFLNKMKEERGWFYGDGFIKGKDDKLITKKDQIKAKGSYSKAPYLTGSLCFDPEDFDETGIRRQYRLKDIYYQWKRNKGLFSGPLLLIKKNIGVQSIPVHLSKRPLSFKNEVIGIHAPYEDFEILSELESLIKGNQTFRFLLSVKSARAGVSRSISTLLQEDIFNLPLPENITDLEVSYAEQILIDDVLSYSLLQLSRGENSPANETAKPEHLLEFGQVYCNALNSVYRNDTKAFYIEKITESKSFYSLTLSYNGVNESFEGPNIERSEESENLMEVMVAKQGKNLRLNRIVKIYERDKIHLIKLKQLRYWLKSTALRDADETFQKMTNAGY